MFDAVVIGSGPNGLVAANILADQGWSVVVLEAEPDPGGAVRSGEILPGHVYDRFSGFYPLAAASPVIGRLELERWGLRWGRAGIVLAHPFEDGTSVELCPRLDDTMASLDALCPGDGEAWQRLLRRWRQIASPFLDGLLDATFPPVAAGARLALALGPHDLLRTARFMLLPLRRLCEEEGLGLGATMLLAGNALHADLSPEAALSGMFGWIMAMLAQEVGFPVPLGGAGSLTQAMVRRLQAKGGRVVCSARVSKIDIDRTGRARGVTTEAGDGYEASRAVIADVAAPILYGRLVDPEHLSPGMHDDLKRFQMDDATFKVNWVVNGSIPWKSEQVERAGTVHLTPDLRHLGRYKLQLAERTIPDHPFVVLGQPSNADPSRAPEGASVIWAYTHVPQNVRHDAGGNLTGRWDEDESERFADRIEEEIERYAPAFRERISTRLIQSPTSLESHDQNLIGGAVNGGAASLYQQAIFRPVPGLGRPETPIPGLFLASASAHPGGGVHGACGANAARSALRRPRARKASTVAAVATAAAAAVAIRRRSKTAKGE